MAIKVERTHHHANTHAPLYSGAVGLPNFLSSIRYFLNRCPSTWEVALANTDPPSRPRSHVHCHRCTAHRKTWLGSFSPELSWVPGRRCNCLPTRCLSGNHPPKQPKSTLPSKTSFSSWHLCSCPRSRHSSRAQVQTPWVITATSFSLPKIQRRSVQGLPLLHTRISLVQTLLTPVVRLHNGTPFDPPHLLLDLHYCRRKHRCTFIKHDSNQTAGPLKVTQMCSVAGSVHSLLPC